MKECINSTQTRTTYLKDYQVPDYLVDSTQLTFELQPQKTLVHSRLQVHRNPAANSEKLPALFLNGVDLELLSIVVDGKELSSAEFDRFSDGVAISVTKHKFTVEIRNTINPQNNTSLEGLYLSNNMYCTQCEAEGFRKITFYPDRPDVMSIFTTTIIAAQTFPVLLANGNEISRSSLEDGRQSVTWHDPFAKPAYLFALVGGDLKSVKDSFVTVSGREVKLQLFTEEKNIGKCAYAIEALKRAMRWDEQTYGREYDLDVFMIVAVDHFNMGAMENKGLNIFNSACVLASSETATDSAFQRIESIVAHEYFHNWSGNRVTCRDWFQLSLKEGFTVFRDAEFSADMNSRTLKRIEDASVLRTAQFMEDAGPMAHPVRPESYMEISNFYTLTVYEKGAEVVRMLHTLLGAEGFRGGSDLYFERHDGCAVTCEDFLLAMEDANNVDLTQFRRWYSQAGTPVLEVRDEYDAKSESYTLIVEQSCPQTPGQPDKLPLHMPVVVGLLDQTGSELPLDQSGGTERILALIEATQRFDFSGIRTKPIPSLLRGFSAPVKLHYDYSTEQLLFLMQHDSDAFNRWDAGRRLAIAALEALQMSFRAGESLTFSSALIEAYAWVLEHCDRDMALTAKMLTLPSPRELAQNAREIDSEAIDAACKFAQTALAQALKPQLLECYQRLNVQKPYKPVADDIAERELKNTCLAYLCVTKEANALELAAQQFARAENMTDSLGALSALVNNAPEMIVADYLEQFYQRWQHDAQVVELWFTVQSSSAYYGTLVRVGELLEHPAFELNNPNKVRAVIGSFAGRNFTQFHASDGSGFVFLAEQVLVMDKLNPQIASRLVIPLTSWRKYRPQESNQMRGALRSIMDAGELSRDLYEVVSKSLA